MMEFARCRVCHQSFDMTAYSMHDIPLDSDGVCDGCRSFDDEDEEE